MWIFTCESTLQSAIWERREEEDMKGERLTLFFFLQPLSRRPIASALPPQSDKNAHHVPLGRTLANSPLLCPLPHHVRKRHQEQLQIQQDD
jgi:hypothetical protein